MKFGPKKRARKCPATGRTNRNRNPRGNHNQLKSSPRWAATGPGVATDVILFTLRLVREVPAASYQPMPQRAREVTGHDPNRIRTKPADKPTGAFKPWRLFGIRARTEAARETAKSPPSPYERLGQSPPRARKRGRKEPATPFQVIRKDSAIGPRTSPP